jgi:predicted O-linked N-acetylglucosamine transferase (SPINDLY family)
VCFEKLYNLPAAYCYFPLANAPGIAPLPYESKGHISFGSFNNPCKLSDEVLDTWAEVVGRVPDSHIHIKVYSSATERYIKNRYAQKGISPNRVHAVYAFPRAEDLMAYYANNIDIVLDTWPCAGCLTSAEAMWMGCPVVTYYGDTFLHRQTWTILNQLGMPELGSDTLEGFVEAAVKLAEDHSRLGDIRKNLRHKMENAPIRDPLGMAKGIIASLEDAWVDWCRSRILLQEALA